MITKTDKLLKKLIGLHPKYIDLSLTRLETLLKKLGNPHHQLPPTIHIAGTNGKGSTLSFITNILESLLCLFTLKNFFISTELLAKGSLVEG